MGNKDYVGAATLLCKQCEAYELRVYRIEKAFYNVENQMKIESGGYQGKYPQVRCLPKHHIETHKTTGYWH